MPIKAITLDWGDTLAANWGMPYLATQRLALGRMAEDLAALGHRPDAGWVQRCMDDIAVQWKASTDAQKNPEWREIDMRAMAEAWVRAVGADPAAAGVRAAIARCDDRFTDTVIPFAETRPVLEALKRRGLKVGILSHVPWPGDACRRWFVRHGWQDLIDFYSLSSEIGFIKPHPAHFQHALAQAGCAPHEVLHVGDHPMRDVEGGRRAGFRTCLRWTENIYPQDALKECRPDAEILQLADLPGVVDRLDT